MDNISGISLDQTFEANRSLTDTTDINCTEYLSPDNSLSELYSTASTTSDMFCTAEDEPEPNLEEFDKNLPHTVTLLRTLDGAKVYVVGTGHFSVESQNDVSKVMQAVRPHILVVELCADRANVMQMDEETIVKEAKDLSLEKLKSIFKETGVFQGILYVLLLKVSASLTVNHGMAPGGEFRRALKEMVKLKRCLLFYGDRPLRITMKRALSKLSWWQSICMFFNLLFSKADISVEEIEKCKQKDILEELMAKLLADYPDLSHVLVSERDIFLTHSLQSAAEKQIHVAGRGRVPTRVVGIVGIGHCSGISKLWGTVSHDDIPPLLVIPEPSRSDIIIKKTVKISFICLTLVGVYYIVPFPKSWSSSIKSACSSVISKGNSNRGEKLTTMEDHTTDTYDHVSHHIFYVPSSIPGKGCDLNAFESQITTSCECPTTCHEATRCACLQRNGQNYSNTLLVEDKLSPYGSVIECNSQCKCTAECPNRLVQFGPNPQLEIIPAGDKGYGLMCKSALQRGQFVCEYAGEVISPEEAAIRRKSDNVNYIFALNEFADQTASRTIIDATYIANIGRYINHSCDPNCIIVPVRVDSVVPKLAIFAIRRISAMEEITYNYNGPSNADAVHGDHRTGGARKLCLCGAANCAKYLPYNP